MGRPSKVSKAILELMEFHTLKEIIKITNIPKSTVYKIIRKYRGDTKIKICGKCETLFEDKCLKCFDERKQKRINNGSAKYGRTRGRRIMLSCINHYSNKTNKCECCGENNVLFLTLSHPNNDGNIHKRELGGGSLYEKLYSSNFKTNYEIIVECYNCNCARTRNNGTCPHNTDIVYKP